MNQFLSYQMLASFKCPSALLCLELTLNVQLRYKCSLVRQRRVRTMNAFLKLLSLLGSGDTTPAIQI